MNSDIRARETRKYGHPDDADCDQLTRNFSNLIIRNGGGRNLVQPSSEAEDSTFPSVQQPALSPVQTPKAPSQQLSPTRARNDLSPPRQVPEYPRWNNEADVSCVHNKRQRDQGNTRLSSSLQAFLPNGWIQPFDAPVQVKVSGLRVFAPVISKSHGRSSATNVVANRSIPIEKLKEVAQKPSYPDVFARFTDEINPSRFERTSTTQSSSYVYYFEVEIKSGAVAVGLVSSETTVGNPGESRGSIGLTAGGQVFVDGKPVTKPFSWTEPFQNGDVVGCGIKLQGTPKVFFTKNGHMIAPLSQFDRLDWKGYLLPSVGMTSGSDAIGIFDHLDMLWKGENGLTIVPPTEHVSQPSYPDPVETYNELSTNNVSSHVEPWFTHVDEPVGTRSASVENPQISSLLKAGYQRGRSSTEANGTPLLQANVSLDLPTPRTSSPLGKSPFGVSPKSRDWTMPGDATKKDPPAAIRNISTPMVTGDLAVLARFGKKGEAPLIDETDDDDKSPPLSFGKRSKKKSLEDDDPNMPSEPVLNIPSNGSQQHLISLPDSRSSLSGRRMPLDEDSPPTPSLPWSHTRAQSNSTASASVASAMSDVLKGPSRRSTEKELDMAAFAESEKVKRQDKVVLLAPDEVEDFKDNARQLRKMCVTGEGEPSILLELCRNNQKKVKNALEGAAKFEQFIDWGELTSLNDIILDAISTASKVINDQKKLPAMAAERNQSQKMGSMIDNKDIFSLICMLRAHGERRLDAALALMKFARDPDGISADKKTSLRDEIRSSGGVHSLLTLFRTNGVTNELKVVVSLAVAYIVPSLLVSSSAISPALGLKIMECLRFLFSARPVSPRNEHIQIGEMRDAAAEGVATFWINALQPLLNSEQGRGKSNADDLLAVQAFATKNRDHSRGFFDQKQESLQTQELLEMTVSLVVQIAKVKDFPSRTRSKIFHLRYTLVEQMCTVDVARPIAVREGILNILVDWMRSGDDADGTNCAACALRDLTSIQDKYMAGWIHSQIVTEGALKELVKLTLSNAVGHSVRLAVAGIFSSLCVAPHTRAAVVEANCISCLIPLLFDHEDPSTAEVAILAGRALLQLAAGAMKRASVFSGWGSDADIHAPADKRYNLVDEIVERGAIGSFVSMAKSKQRGELRLMAIQALRVLSEDTSRKRQTRLQLCTDGAADALGHVLKEDASNLTAYLKSNASHEVINKDLVVGLHQALIALANILEPIQVEGSPSMPPLAHRDPTKVLVDGCIETTRSGGLEGLLLISSLPLRGTFLDTPSDQGIDIIDLLEEACRSLASLSPLLLSQTAASEGYACFACFVLQALTSLFRKTSEDGTAKLTSRVLKTNALRGLSALASSEALKTMIVDKSLPYLLQEKSVREDSTNSSSAASQVCISLGFADDEIAAQVAGNDPKLLGDWFCLQRSLLIQAMVRTELRRVVLDTWATPLEEARKRGGTTELKRDVSRTSNSSSGDELPSEIKSVNDLFDNFANDKESSNHMKTIVHEYRDMFELGKTDGYAELAKLVGDTKEQVGLLSRHVYPLNSVESEREWILAHGQSTSDAGQQRPALIDSRVQLLLSLCFPSRVIQDFVLPVGDLQPEASFNFRAITMPQRRYFSFRREGQLIARLCEKEAANLETEQVHWTLAFTNSSFAGEFTETLAQALYRCPMIEGLTFAKDSEWSAIRALDDVNEIDEGSASLANLVGSLPHWISHLTFCNTMNDRTLKTLVVVLEAVGKLASGELLMSQNVSSAFQNVEKGSRPGDSQGKFWSFAITNSVGISMNVWELFFKLLGRIVPSRQSVFGPPPLGSLKVLDLSGNNLGDEGCSSVLKLVYDKDSGCRLEQLDISKNRIGRGAMVSSVLRSYVKTHRYNQGAGMNSKPRTWESSLRVLNLAQNELHLGKVGLDTIVLLKHDALSLRSLDLSNNKLEAPEYAEVLASSVLKNTTLRFFDLSGNNFDPHVIDTTLGRLTTSQSESALSFMRFDSNTPCLTESQQSKLNSWLETCRRNAIERFLKERKHRNGAENPELTEHALSRELDPSVTNALLMPARSGLLDDSSIISMDDHISGISGQGNLFEFGNMITVLFSAPLVCLDQENNYRPFAQLDFDMERELLWQCLKEASRDIELSFDTATLDRLLTTMTKKCTCLHYSGHGHQNFLPFEDGRGGTDWIEVNKIQSLIERDGVAPFKFVFVSACHSGLAGETFVRSGVPHVVCCQQDSELKDTAALAFTRQFYLALAMGYSVKDSFEQGRKAVRASPNLRDPEREMSKFVLLPLDGNHDVPVFNASPVREWPPPGESSRHLQSSRSRRKILRTRSAYAGGAKSSELSVRNMMQEDPSPTPPQFFLGREVDMYRVLKGVLDKRLVSVVGETGVGRSSLACALCHYINERKSTIETYIERIYFIRPKQGKGVVTCRSLILQLLDKIVEAGKARPPAVLSDTEVVQDAICKSLKNDKALIVFDRTELLEGQEEADEFPVFLSKLFQETGKNVRVLLTGRQSLGIASIGGQVEQHFELGPLDFHNSVRLFANLCPHLHTRGERKDLYERLVIDSEQANLCTTDSGLDARTQRIFSALGDGYPARIAQAAFVISVDMLQKLGGWVDGPSVARSSLSRNNSGPEILD